MSRARHHMKDGGVMDKDPAPKEVYEGAGSHVVHEADEKKHGGRTKKHYKDGGHVMGHHGKKRLDRPGRKRGGGVGADTSPLTTAARVTSAEDHHADQGNADKKESD